jgi:hypothetical protein
MTTRVQALWASASACLLVSPIAFIGGGALLFAAVDEVYRSSRTPPAWLVVALTVCGFGLFGIGATAWLRACRLVLLSRRRPQSTG